MRSSSSSGGGGGSSSREQVRQLCWGGWLRHNVIPQQHSTQARRQQCWVWACEQRSGVAAQWAKERAGGWGQKQQWHTVVAHCGWARST
jgi:hypothetical protein